ncbi:MAG TPA: response regulator transcription factor [Thermoleophilaceae bacterium]|jgi:DNA-binding response OmpR family regulator
MAPVRLAIVDSDSGFVTVLTKRLDAIGWHHRTLDAPVAPRELVAMRLNVLVLDVTLLGQQAWDYIERVGEGVPGLGLIVCTPQSTVAQRVRGLRLGADDWINKPCHPEEVIARIEAVIRRRRRASTPAERGPVVAGELEVRADRFQVFVGGHSADLTRREFELLELLVDAHGQVLEREEIYQRVWGYAMAHGDRSVDVFVRKLRQKLEARSPGWTYIHTHFGIGYRFQPEPKDGGGEDLPAPEPAPSPGDEAPAAPREGLRDEPLARGRSLAGAAA